MTKQTLTTVVSPTAEPNATWNFWVNVLDIVFFTLGASIVARDTVMPALVSKLTDSKMALGFVPGDLQPRLLSAPTLHCQSFGTNALQKAICDVDRRAG